MHANGLFTETISSSPQTAPENNFESQSTTANLKGTKSMPNLSSAKSQKEISESEPKRKGRGTSHFGKPEIAFGTRISPGNDIKRLSTPDIKQGIIFNSRFGHSARDDNQKSVGKTTNDQEKDTDRRDSSAFTRYASGTESRESSAFNRHVDDYSVKDREEIYADE